MLQFVKDTLWVRLNSWNKKSLTRVGREVLLKTVLQALPNYVMSMFLLPKMLCEKLQQVMARFSWGKGRDHQCELHWVSWDSLSLPKKFGGLSFKKVYQFNLAMVGKIRWRLLCCHHSLLARFLKAQYFPTTKFLHAQQV